MRIQWDEWVSKNDSRHELMTGNANPKILKLILVPNEAAHQNQNRWNFTEVLSSFWTQPNWPILRVNEVGETVTSREQLNMRSRHNY